MHVQPVHRTYYHKHALSPLCTASETLSRRSCACGANGRHEAGRQTSGAASGALVPARSRAHSSGGAYLVRRLPSDSTACAQGADELIKQFTQLTAEPAWSKPSLWMHWPWCSARHFQLACACAEHMRESFERSRPPCASPTWRFFSADGPAQSRWMARVG